MTPTELRKAADYLEDNGGATMTVSELRKAADYLEQETRKAELHRRMLERADVRVSVRLGDVAQALHAIEDFTWQSDVDLPAGVKALEAVVKVTMIELLIGELV